MFVFAAKCALVVVGAKTATVFACYALKRVMNRFIWSKMTGKWIVITGASDGIGKELAIGLAKRKMKIVLLGRNKQKLDVVCQQVKADAADCRVIVADLMNAPPDDIFDGYDIGMLINNAGCCTPAAYAFEHDVQPILNVNMCAPLLITPRVLKKMSENRFGYVLNIGSQFSELPAPFYAAYAASKAMIKAWSVALHYEMKPFGVHVECIVPGMVCTKMTAMKTPTLAAPSASAFAECVLSTCGSCKVNMPYIPHLVSWLVASFIPDFICGRMMYHACLRMRSAAQRKKKRQN